VLLGEAYASLAGAYVKELSPPALFWANAVSAALDNATVISIEIRGMPLNLTREAVLSLLASGGMLIQGNIPNIIAAGALGISATNWARVGIPIGLSFLVSYFLILRLACDSTRQIEHVKFDCGMAQQMGKIAEPLGVL
jgi:predicted cation transporter